MNNASIKDIENIKLDVIEKQKVEKKEKVSNIDCCNEDENALNPSVFVRCGEMILKDQLSFLELSNNIKCISSKLTSTFPFIRREGLRNLIEALKALSKGALDPFSGQPIDNMTKIGVNPHLLKSWEITSQRAFSINLITPMFHRIIPCRDLVLGLIGGGGTLSLLDLVPSEAALQWTTCARPQKLIAIYEQAATSAAKVATQLLQQQQQQFKSQMSQNFNNIDNSSNNNNNVEENNNSKGNYFNGNNGIDVDTGNDGIVNLQSSIFAKRQQSAQKGTIAAHIALSDVSLYEQELALRAIQGLCILVPSQKSHVSESPLIPFAIESFWYCLKHVQQLHVVEKAIAVQSKKITRLSNAASNLILKSMPSDDNNVSDKNDAKKNLKNSVINEMTDKINETEEEKKVKKLVGSKRSDDSNSFKSVDNTLLREEANGEKYIEDERDENVDLEEVRTMRPELLKVMCSIVDAIEAACHFSPKCINQLVQLNGVKHTLTLACCPYTPSILRCTIFDTISFLMQEVIPFRKAAISANDNDPLPTMSELDVELTTQSDLSHMQQKYSASKADEAFGAASPALMPNFSPSMNFYMDRATASKFDSAVRSWLNQNHLFTYANTLLSLRDVGGVGIPDNSAKNLVEVERIVYRARQQREKIYGEFLAIINEKRIATIP